MDKFLTPEYERSRKSYVVQATVEYMVSLLIADVYLAKLLSSIGISDGLIGIISSFITLAFVFQFFSFFLAKSKTNSKKLVMIFDTMSILFFMFIYLIPFLPCSKNIRSIILVLSILIAYLFKYLVQNILFKWANSYVNPKKRASFSANKEMVSLFSGMIFTIFVGYVIDIYESHNNLSGGFLFIASAILILNICNFISLVFIKKETKVEEVNDTEPIFAVLKKLLKNKNFRNVVILTSTWDVARYFTIGFMGIFKSKDLMISVFLVQIINVLANTSRLLISKPMGSYADNNSYVKGYKLGLCMAAFAFFINMFTTKSTWGLVIVFTILYNASFAGTNHNSFNMVYSYVDLKYITQAMSIKNCVGGLLGFGASVLGGKILNALQANNNMIFEVHIYGQQILSGISFVITIIAIVFATKVVEKQKILIQ